ncbi:MAG TPA: hypothetical protein VGE83_04385 [Terracidiphilus sp.]|jgi:hypothetical protein
MGITPITNLTPLPLSRSIEPDLEPLPMARVENSARTGDETYSPGNGKSARGSEDDAPEDDFDDLGDDGQEELTSQPTAYSQARQISFFA